MGLFLITDAETAPRLVEDFLRDWRGRAERETIGRSSTLQLHGEHRRGGAAQAL